MASANAAGLSIGMLPKPSSIIAQVAGSGVAPGLVGPTTESVSRTLPKRTVGLGAFSAPIYYANVAKRFRARLNPSNARNANPMPISTHVEGSGAPKATPDGSESLNRTSAYHAAKLV